jgi:hypothetical protein
MHLISSNYRNRTVFSFRCTYEEREALDGFCFDDIVNLYQCLDENEDLPATIPELLRAGSLAPVEHQTARLKERLRLSARGEGGKLESTSRTRSPCFGLKRVCSRSRSQCCTSLV